jgi:hypothetical protein
VRDHGGGPWCRENPELGEHWGCDRRGIVIDLGLCRGVISLGGDKGR